jgi:hypothetical protein
MGRLLLNAVGDGLGTWIGSMDLLPSTTVVRSTEDRHFAI